MLGASKLFSHKSLHGIFEGLVPLLGGRLKVGYHHEGIAVAVGQGGEGIYIAVVVALAVIGDGHILIFARRF